MSEHKESIEEAIKEIRHGLNKIHTIRSIESILNGIESDIKDIESALDDLIESDIPESRLLCPACHHNGNSHGCPVCNETGYIDDPIYEDD